MYSLFTQSAAPRKLGGNPASALCLIQTAPVFTEGNVYQGPATEGPDGNATAPIAAPPVTTLPVAEMPDGVRARAGCLPHDAIDAKYVATTSGWKVNATTALRPTVPENGPLHPGGAFPSRRD